MSDPINPSHYDAVDGSDVDCRRAMLAMIGFEGMKYFHAGNVLKYLWRWERKNGVEDLRKATRHVEFLIALEEGHEGVSSVVRGAGDAAMRGSGTGEECGTVSIRIAAASEDGGEVPGDGVEHHSHCGEVS